MSPEQAAGLVDQLSPATDIYSLGATLYAILTGHAPVAHDQPRIMLNEVILGRFPRPRQLEPNAPRELEAICMKAMARDTASRYATAQEMAADIEAWLAGELVSAYRERWVERARRWRRRHPRLVSGAAAALAAAAISLGVSSIFLHEAKRTAEDREREARQNFHLARAAVDQYLTRVADDSRLQEADLEQLRNELLTMAQKFYEQLIKIRPDEAGLQYDRAWAQSRLARIARQFGRLKEAVESMDRAEDQFVALLKKSPATSSSGAVWPSAKANWGFG
jgi:serine/threonine-protein kinase